jgi:putative inorganic carbon (hco3(-)) transporter
MQSGTLLPGRRETDFGAFALSAFLRPLHIMVAAPEFVFVGTLGVFLFRPPDLELHHLDRIAFVLLCAAVLVRVAASGDKIWPVSQLIWPMSGLLGLTLIELLLQPFHAQTWSLAAAKFGVPYAMFFLAGAVFTTPRAIRCFEIFCLLVLGYLSFVSVASLAGAEALILPRYILNPDLGIHLDRARGPFLQAVANGLVLTLLGLIAFDALRAQRIEKWKGLLLLVPLPVAILATMTRAVWISFAFAIGTVVLQTKGAVRKAGLAVAAFIVGLGAIIVCIPGLNTTFNTTVEERVEERGPIEVRMAVYRAASEMIAEHPLLGWGLNRMPVEVASRMENYHLDAYWAHNTYLEILVEQGILGLALYLWILVGLFRMRSTLGQEAEMETTLLNSGFRRTWFLMLMVYAFNGFFVVLNYQFVNALIFSIAGMLAAQNRRLEVMQ